MHSVLQLQCSVCILWHLERGYKSFYKIKKHREIDRATKGVMRSNTLQSHRGRRGDT